MPCPQDKPVPVSEVPADLLSKVAQLVKERSETLKMSEDNLRVRR